MVVKAFIGTLIRIYKIKYLIYSQMLTLFIGKKSDSIEFWIQWNDIKRVVIGNMCMKCIEVFNLTQITDITGSLA